MIQDASVANAFISVFFSLSEKILFWSFITSIKLKKSVPHTLFSRSTVLGAYALCHFHPYPTKLCSKFLVISVNFQDLNVNLINNGRGGNRDGNKLPS